MHHRPGEWPLAWQWWSAPDPDQPVGVGNPDGDYLAGFRSREEAVAYGARAGFPPPDSPP